MSLCSVVYEYPALTGGFVFCLACERLAYLLIFDIISSDSAVAQR